MTIAKIHPNPSNTSNSSSSHTSSSERLEIYTLWMKSLVFHGNGCTVFNSRGEVVFRVDNYQQRRGCKVFLMDTNGRVLFSIHRKKIGFCRYWEGFRWSNKQKPWFRVMRNFNTFFSKYICLRVSVLESPNDQTSCYYKIIGLEGKSALKIMDLSGELLAEAVQKESRQGVCLGEDVLRLMVQPQADQSLIMALVTVYGLFNNKI